MPLLNLTDYTVLEHVLFATGCVLWVVTYVIVIRAIRRRRFVEIPLVAVCANFAWEFLWSFVFTTDMGALYVWGYRLWFFLDCYIVYGLLRFGWKQLDDGWLRAHAPALAAATWLGWMGMLYFFIADYDAPLTHMGALSGYVLNVMMSALYIPLLLRRHGDEAFSYAAAWCKGIGTLLISVFCFLHFTDGLLLSMCVVTAVLDAAYIGFFAGLRRGRPRPAARLVATAN